jgi:pimeloyl-ACP methyl ester carboxylesterase
MEFNNPGGGMMNKIVRIILRVLGGLLVIVALATGGYVLNNLTYFDRAMAAVRRAGFVEKQVTIAGNVLNYAEGPENGPPLLLIHGQAVDWKHYARVLPALADHYHVFAVDCYGHGGSARAPETYSNVALGTDLALFLEDVIGEPAVVSGHSSGGLLAAWLAANRPALVRGVVLEDPPFFTTTLPRAKKTWNYVDLATTAHTFLASDEEDFVAYNTEQSKFMDLFEGLQPVMTRDVLAARAAHPQEPVVLWYMPPLMNEMFRGLHHYDPRFGETFYTGAWNDGFDHAEALRRIDVPSVLIHTNWHYDDEGILQAAMDGEDAARARALLQDAEFYKADSGHGFHFEKPRTFVQILVEFKERLGE